MLLGKETINLKASTWEWIQLRYQKTMDEYGKIPEYHEWLKHFPDEFHYSNWSNKPGNETMCSFMRMHNRFAKEIWVNLEEDKNSTNEHDPLVDVTPEMAREVGYFEDEHGNQHMNLFDKVNVPVSRWSPEYYTEEMNEVFQDLLGYGLTKNQAYYAIYRFDEYLDNHDVRLELPVGCDELYPSEDCVFCEKDQQYHIENDSDLDCYQCKEEECRNYEPFEEEEEDDDEF